MWKIRIQSDSKVNTVPFFVPIIVIELKTRKLIGSCQRAGSNQIPSQHCAITFRQGSSLAHVREQDPIRFNVNTVPFFMPIIVVELKRMLIGSCQRAGSDQIQSQHRTIHRVHYRRRAKDKEAHWLTSESKIQLDSTSTLNLTCKLLYHTSPHCTKNSIECSICAMLRK